MAYKDQREHLLQVERHRVAREDVPAAQLLYLVPAVVARGVVGHDLRDRVEVADHHIMVTGYQ